MTAVNEEFVTDEEIIGTGDTVAFIPPLVEDKKVLNTQHLFII